MTKKTFTVDLINTTVFTMNIEAENQEEAEQIAYSRRLTADFNAHNHKNTKVCLSSSKRIFADNTIRTIFVCRKQNDRASLISNEWSIKK